MNRFKRQDRLFLYWQTPPIEPGTEPEPTTLTWLDDEPMGWLDDEELEWLDELEEV